MTNLGLLERLGARISFLHDKMNKQPLISVITINYNNKEGLKKTLDSVISQSFDDYEQIIIDGASSDGSVEVIKNALANDAFASHVGYWVSEKDGGIYPAMNKGLEHANGKYFLMLNSGDFFTDDFLLENVSKRLPENPNCVVFGAVDYFDKNGYYETYSISHNRLNEHNICHQACFIGRKVHDEVGKYDCNYEIVADYDFLSRAYKKGIAFVHVPFVIANCEMGGASQARIKKSQDEFTFVRVSYFPDDKEKKKSKGAQIKSFLGFLTKLILPGFAVLLLKAVFRLLKRLVRREKVDG